MRILVIGGGAREHALVWKIVRSELVETIYAYPGNAGISEIAKIPELKNGSLQELLEFAKGAKIDLTVVGPEKYLAEGIVDLFLSEGLNVFGVNKKAAMLETSKAFAKDLMKKYNIPTAKYFVVEDLSEGYKLLKSLPYPLVLKADGLAAGKGVSIVHDPLSAKEEFSAMTSGKFSDAGKKVVIEEFLEGEELSLLLLVDGNGVIPLNFSQDHKAAFDGDSGPNTGGMGAYTPVSIADDALYGKINDTIILPLLDGFKKEGIDYKGVLYIGVMLVNGVPYVLEYNVRFGDPEIEALLFGMKSDIVPYLIATCEGTLSSMPPIKWKDGYSITVVVASGGYPGNYSSGRIISGLGDVHPKSVVFHAGTRFDDQGRFVTAGGRVLMITSRGDTIGEALKNVYDNVEKISFEGAFYRKDIAHRELKREWSK